MSVQVITWALKQHPGNSRAKHVLTILANYADENGVCYPSTRQICEDTDMNRKTVLRVMAHLREEGWIVDTGERRGQTGQIAVYRLSIRKRSQKRDCSTVPKTVPVPNLEPVPKTTPNGPKNGTSKRSQIWDTEPSYRTVREPSVDISLTFEAFWKAYPKRKARGAAERAYRKALERAPPEQILAGAMRYAAERDGEDPKFTAHPATWLNADRWKDEPDDRRDRTVSKQTELPGYLAASLNRAGRGG